MAGHILPEGAHESPTDYQALARRATYQSEVVLDALLHSAQRQDERLDLLVTSLALRLKQLNSVVMSVLGDDGDIEMTEIVDGAAA